MMWVRFFVLSACLLLLSACVTAPTVKDYTAYKVSKPRSILVLPPINNSPDVGAGLSLLSVTTLPLAEAGYYVIPVAPVYETFKSNGVTVAEDAHDISREKLREIFGADAALYITVGEYGSSYKVINTVVTVAASARLVDLRTGTTLWQGEAKATSAENQGSGGLLEMLITAVVAQVANHVSDEAHQYADLASRRMLSAGKSGGLLYGPYNPKYGTD